MTAIETLFSLKGRHAVVCGSTQGIGRAIATCFARLGAGVTLVARDEVALKRTRAELDTAAGQSHGTLGADFSRPDALRERIGAWLGAGNTAHILVNNTGGPPAGPIADAAPDVFIQAVTMHVVCNQILAQALIPGMKAAGYGRIINIISTSVKEPIPGLGVSNTTRGAVASWAKTLSRELAPFGITVNNILPGFTDTARLAELFQGKAEKQGVAIDKVRDEAVAKIPAARLADPDEIAAAAAFLAAPAASYVNGINLPVDGGRLNCL